MVLQWKFDGSRPVYVQIMEHIRSAVLVGEYPLGARIPPVRDLSAQAQVNPNTMQRAMLELEREGLVVTCGTFGRFVTQDRTVLEQMRKQAVHTVAQASAAQFRALGLTMTQAAQLLLSLEEEETHGECIANSGTDQVV